MKVSYVFPVINVLKNAWVIHGELVLVELISPFNDPAENGASSAEISIIFKNGQS